MFNYMVNQNKNFKLQMQPHAMPVSDLYLTKVTLQNILSHLIWILILILSSEPPESSVGLPILTLLNHAFEL